MNTQLGSSSGRRENVWREALFDWSTGDQIELPWPKDSWPDLQKAIAALPTADKDLSQIAWQTELDKTDIDLDRTRTRAGSLYLAVGVISGLTGLTGQAISGLGGADIPATVRAALAAAVILLAALLLYSAFRAVWLAYRAQLVSVWGLASVELPTDASGGGHPARDRYLLALFTAARNNQARLRIPIGYLVQAQRCLAMALVVLAVLVLTLLAASSLQAIRPVDPTTRASPAPTRVP